MSSTFQQLLHLAQAGASLVHIASYEWERVRGQVIGLANELELPLRTWSQSTGLLVCEEGVDVTPDEAADEDDLVDSSSDTEVIVRRDPPAAGGWVRRQPPRIPRPDPRDQSGQKGRSEQAEGQDTEVMSYAALERARRAEELEATPADNTKETEQDLAPESATVIIRK